MDMVPNIITINACMTIKTMIHQAMLYNISGISNNGEWNLIAVDSVAPHERSCRCQKNGRHMTPPERSLLMCW